jgi:hypothetical protein
LDASGRIFSLGHGSFSLLSLFGIPGACRHAGKAYGRGGKIVMNNSLLPAPWVRKVYWFNVIAAAFIIAVARLRLRLVHCPSLFRSHAGGR